MSKFRHLTLEELLFRAEDAARYSPLIEELVRRLRYPNESGEPDQKNDQFHEADCPVCEAKLEMCFFVEETAPRLTKVET